MTELYRIAQVAEFDGHLAMPEKPGGAAVETRQPWGVVPGLARNEPLLAEANRHACDPRQTGSYTALLTKSMACFKTILPKPKSCLPCQVASDFAQMWLSAS